MVKPFQFSRIPKIYFKCGNISDLPFIARTFGDKIVLVTGKSSFIRSQYAEKLFQGFDETGISYTIIHIPEEPSPDIIDKTVKVLYDKEVNLVIGVGGGSVMDAGKAISAMINKTESIVDFLEGVGNKDHPGTKIPYIAIPTTSGTGSEATKNAVISRIGKEGFKKSLRHDNFVPDIAMVDPELTLQCPGDITAASGMDCFTQLSEAFLSVKSNQYTDALCLEGLKAIKSSLLRCYTNGDDIEARTDMSFAAITSGICIANAGLGVIHGFASSVGGKYNIPHGIICGTLMAKSNEVNVRELRKKPGDFSALRKYALLGRLFLDNNGKTDDYHIDGFIQFLYDLTNRFNLPGFRRYGFEEDKIEKICAETELKNNPVKLGLADLIEIIYERF